MSVFYSANEKINVPDISSTEPSVPASQPTSELPQEPKNWLKAVPDPLDGTVGGDTSTCEPRQSSGEPGSFNLGCVALISRTIPLPGTSLGCSAHSAAFRYPQSLQIQALSNNYQYFFFLKKLHDNIFPFPGSSTKHSRGSRNIQRVGKSECPVWLVFSVYVNGRVPILPNLSKKSCRLQEF